MHFFPPDSLDIFDVSSPVLSANEAVLRSRPERASFTSTSGINDTPVHFRTERDTFVRLLLGDREAEFVDIHQLRLVDWLVKTYS